MTTGAPPPTYPARPRRSRLRTFLPLGVAAWLVLEIWLLTVVAGSAGGFTVFLLLVAGFVAGSAVVKRAGRRAFRALSETLQQQQGAAGEPGAGGGPGKSEGNGFLMLGGLLLMLPGLVSDAVGLVLLIPPVQKALGRYAERTFERKIREAGSGGLGDAFQQARIHRPDGKVVQGEVIRDDEGFGDASPPQGPRPPLNR
ncbi:FxsA family protein [Streptomyces europaeiscabiei]|uniref:FxsA family membrane protein n=1 Tax=Streptomyces europaeiscabiei TaxID=146819 RepID=UPI0029B421B5|nr:FxsA family membrane protein [Streptomyces europaeiscabiei]MDX3587777.1 FxsA family protein [Streptomyces europaeiscabiei]MDX3616383.1 FxsA family protein [Streptomyces europaeiscabiei]MDX3630285.1 FxsA family protein [Streptomyces europaeiscabiei]MDX3652537.1 FxsA family protein [Streptomyces europaeiscabiei]WUD31322.1 FxsA family protein [Streptomyces europaeiscabiei]